MMRQRGFILAYVLAMLAMMAAVLYPVSRSQGGAKLAEQGLEAIESREMLSVLDFVTTYAREHVETTDPRFTAFVAQARREEALRRQGDERIQYLQSMLNQLGFQIDLGSDQPTGSSQGSTASQAGRGATSQTIGARYSVGATEHVLRLGERRYRVRLHPINRRPNLNTMDRETLLRVIRAEGVDPALAEHWAGVITDWIDEDDWTSPAGAEADAYAVRGLAWRPRNRPIESWSELAYLLDFTPQTVAWFREHFTLWGGGAAIATGLTPERMVALTGLAPSAVATALQHHEMLGRGGAAVGIPLADVLGEEAALAFTRRVTWGADDGYAEIEIRGEKTRLLAIYRQSDGKLLDIRFE